MKRLILCADDFGYNDNVSLAILDLLDRKRLSATSCMTDFPAWEKYSSHLKAIGDQCDVGLHFNLTDNFPESVIKHEPYDSLYGIMINCLIGNIDRKYIESEFCRQLEKFTDFYGKLPDYIDGHQHVHQFPIIQSVVVDQIERIYKNRPYPYLRVTTPIINKNIDPVKSFVISAYGAGALKKKLTLRKINFNHAFAGIYKFDKFPDYRNYIDSWMASLSDLTIMMCHPGLPGKDPQNDPIYRSRCHEYEVLKSQEFLDICNKYHITISRFHQN
ncbi:MAG: ChbG/HpnK family deacetylase [Gammaproteobacteria bacterium]|nr:ChbG/HpnK family deacetylase [Gammaproteobacteria bacterium]